MSKADKDVVFSDVKSSKADPDVQFIPRGAVYDFYGADTLHDPASATSQAVTKQQPTPRGSSSFGPMVTPTAARAIEQADVSELPEVSKALMRSGGTLGATAIGTLPEMAGQAIAGPRSADTVPQQDASAFVNVPPTAPPPGTPSDIAPFLTFEGQQFERTPQPITGGPAPFAGAGARAREAFGLNNPALQKDPQLSPTNTPYLDFSGETPFLNKLNRLATEVADAVGPIGAITAASMAGGPVGGGTAGALLFGAAKYDEEIEKGTPPNEAMEQAAVYGGATGALFAIPVTHSIARFLPDKLASRLLVTAAHSAEMGGKGVGVGTIDGIMALENTPQSVEEWRDALTKIYQGDTDPRSHFLSYAVLGIPGGLMTPLGRSRARQAAQDSLNDFVDLGDAKPIPKPKGRPTPESEITGPERGLSTQPGIRRPGVDPDVRFEPGARALPGESPQRVGFEPLPPLQDAPISTAPAPPVPPAGPRAYPPLNAGPPARPGVSPRLEPMAKPPRAQLPGEGPAQPVGKAIDIPAVEARTVEQTPRQLAEGRVANKKALDAPVTPIERAQPPQEQQTPPEATQTTPEPLKAAEAPVAKAPHEMSKKEFAVEQVSPVFDAVQRKIEQGGTVTVRTAWRHTPISRPEHIRMTQGGKIQVPRPGKGQKWDTLTDAQVDDIGAQAGIKPPAFGERIYHKSAVEDAIRAGLIEEHPDYPGLKDKLAQEDAERAYEESLNTPVAEFVGWQEMSKGQEPVAFYNIPEGEGYSTVSAETARERGFTVPEPTTPKPVAQPDFEEMVNEARRWRGAAKNLDDQLTNIKDRLRLNNQTTKGDLDAYIQRKFGVSEIEARNVSNELTRRNLPDDLSASPEEFSGEPWFKSVVKEPLTTPEPTQESQFSPETQAIIDIYGSRAKALATLRNQKARAKKNNEQVAPETDRAIEELTLGGKVGATPTKQSQGDLFGASEIEVAPGSQTELIAENVPAQYVDTTDTQLAEFRRRVRQFGVKAPSGSLSWEDLGFNETRPPAAKKGSGRGWDQWLEEAYEMGLISEAERSSPSVLGDLLRGRNQNRTPVAPEGVNVPGVKNLENTRQTGGVESVASVLERSGIVKTAAPTPTAPKQRQSSAKAAPDIRQQIVSAALENTGGSYNERVRLADLREALPSISRKQLDETLKQMQEDGDLVLYRFDNPLEMEPRDRGAQLMLGNDPRDMIYLKRGIGEQMAAGESEVFRARVYRGGSAGVAPRVEDASGTNQFGPGVYFGGEGTAAEWASARPDGVVEPYEVAFRAPYIEEAADLVDPRHRRVADALIDAGLPARMVEKNYGGLGSLTFLTQALGRHLGEKSLFPGSKAMNAILRDAGFDGIVAEFRDGLQYVALKNDVFRRAGEETTPQEPAPTTGQQPKASVPITSKAHKEIAGMLPPEVARYNEFEGRLDFDATFDGTSKLRDAMYRAIEESNMAKSRKPAMRTAADKLMDRVFAAQEKVQGKAEGKGKKGPDFTNPEAGAINIGVYYDAAKKVGKAILNPPQLRFRKGFDEAVRDFDVQRRGRATAIVRDIERAVADVGQAYRKSVNIKDRVKSEFTGIPRELNEKIDWLRREEDPYMKADILLQFPEQMREPILTMLSKIDALSDLIVKEGAANGKLGDIIISNEGVYLKRSFAKFKEPEKWRRNISSVAEERMRDMIRRNHQEYAEMENGDLLVERILNEYRDAYQDKETGRIVFRGGLLGTKDMSSLKARKNLPPELLEFWGVERGGIENVLQTATTQANLLTNSEFQYRTLKHGRDNHYIFTPEDRVDIISGKAPREKIAAYRALEEANQLVNMTEKASTRDISTLSPQTQALGPLHDTLVDKRFKAALENAMKVYEHAPWVATLQQANALIKMGKTVGSISTQSLNFFSNIGVAWNNGHLSYHPERLPTRITEALGMTGAELTDRTFKTYRERVGRAIELGVMGDTVGAGELQKLLEDARASKATVATNIIAEYGEKWMREQSKAKKAVGIAMQMPKELVRELGVGRDTAIAIYQAGDDFWKAFAWLTQTEIEQAARPNLTRVEVEVAAAKYVRNHYHTYSELPELAQALRRFPIFGTFLAFHVETPRVSYNLLASNIQDMQDPAMRAQALNRVASAGVFFAGTTGLAALSSLLWGMTSDDEEAMLDAVPPWDKNAQFLKYRVDRENGIINAWNISRSDVYAGVTDPVRAALRSEGMDEMATRTLLALTGPLSQEELGFKALRQFLENRNDYNQPIVLESDTRNERIKKIAAHFGKDLRPGTFDSLERIKKDKRPLAKLLAESAGVRITEIDMPKSLKYRALEYRREYIKQFSDLNKAIKAQSTDTIKEQWDQLVEWDMARKLEILKVTQGLVKFGVNHDLIEQALKDGGISKSDAKKMVEGTFEYRPPREKEKEVSDLGVETGFGPAARPATSGSLFY